MNFYMGRDEIVHKHSGFVQHFSESLAPPLAPPL